MFVVLLLLASASALITGLLSGNRLSAKLQTLVGQLHAQGVDVLEASGQVSETSERLSSASAQQAAALQQTVAAVNEISAMVGRTADMATQSRNSSQSSRNVASDGKRTVDDMIDSMMQIKESNGSILMQVEEGNKEISQIVKVISEIGNKTKVINDIVFQTKLLSFNASVEAARAGEHGKGFAVVAEEVGNLAQMSGQAAKEISDLLEQSVVQVQTIVDQTGSRVEKLIVDARERVAVGEDTAKRCAAMLEQILLNADEVNSLVNEIATSAQEQARGVQEINSAMTELDHVTQQNSAAAAQASSLSGSLMVQSQSLSTLVGTLNALVSGDTGGVSPTSGVPGSSSGATPSTSLRSLGDQHSSRPAVPRTMDASTGAGFVDEAKGGNVRSLASGLRNSRGASGRRQSPHDSSMFGEGGTAMRDSGVPRSNDPRFED
jgi:methyl-accepting chemotaxis protein